MSARFNVVALSVLGTVALHAAVSLYVGSRGIRAASAAEQTGTKLSGTLDVATESCTHTTPAGGVEFVYAQHSYPGMSAAQLSQVRTLGRAASRGVNGTAYRLPAYPFASPDGLFEGSQTIYVRDESVAVLCGAPNAPWFDTVTFTLVK